MIRKRKFTVTYELPEELFNVLEEQAKREGRPMAEVIAECNKEMRFIRPPVSPEEEERSICSPLQARRMLDGRATAY